MALAYVVQHGEKEPVPGDPGLTPAGRRQASRTGRWLHGRRVHAVYTSPVRRARETADRIASVTGLAVQPDVRLAERLNWDGCQPYQAFLTLWAHRQRPRVHTPRWGIIPAGRGAAAGIPGQPARHARAGRGAHPRRDHHRPAAQPPRRRCPAAAPARRGHPAMRHHHGQRPDRRHDRLDRTSSMSLSRRRRSYPPPLDIARPAADEDVGSNAV
jgi:Histidine phosphatase superfamily (branch 1)